MRISNNYVRSCVIGRVAGTAALLFSAAVLPLGLSACASSTPQKSEPPVVQREWIHADGLPQAVVQATDEILASPKLQEALDKQQAEQLADKLNIVEYVQPELDHGPKPAEFQRYIVLHDTEGGASGKSIIDWWVSSGNKVAAHFVVDRDGTITQCVPIDRIAHHAGFGDTGHNQLYGVEDESRDDKAGTVPIGRSFADYGMNSYSIGIEMNHVGGEGPYPQAQLEAVDGLIAYLDKSFGGNAGRIIDHKAWRSGNSDTSAEFATYLENYQTSRTHDGVPYKED